jgi:signal transduction histidine kinase/ActR/RegA family two-component response regulator
MKSLISSILFRGFISIPIVGFALGIRILFLGGIGASIPYLTFYPAIMIAALIGGAISGVLATCLSGLLAWYFFIDPVNLFIITSRYDALGIFVFFISGSVMSAAGEMTLGYRNNSRKKRKELENSNKLLLQEIKERKQSEVKLRESQAKLEAAIASIPDGIVITDSDGVLINYNEKFARLSRFKTKTDVVKIIDDYPNVFDVYFINGELAPLDQWAVPRALRGEIANNVEYVIKRKDTGKTWTGSYNFGPVIDTSGKKIGCVMIVRDVTEEKQKERQLVDAKNLAEAANKTKSSFLANMSHEIRTPLNGVLGMLQLLNITNPNNEQKEYILAATQSAKRLTKLLSDILDISKIDSLKIVVSEVGFNVRKIVDLIQETFALESSEKQITLKFVHDESIPRVLIGDEARLRQILFNLVGNAIKFTEKGYILVESLLLPISKSNMVQILFTIQDSGIGISDENIDKIFEPFMQAESSYTRRFQGAGLGLSIVWRLVKLMNGTISIDSAVGTGTTFYVSLPFKRPVASFLTENASAQIECIEKDNHRKILLVEDDALCLLASKRLLEKFGYSVVSATDGYEALQRLSEQDFDLILMDIQMPNMNGLEATKAIRMSTLPGNKSQIPIIAMTAYAMPGDKEKFLEAGVNEYITKPVDGELLLTIIRKVKPLRQLKDRANVLD